MSSDHRSGSILRERVGGAGGKDSLTSLDHASTDATGITAGKDGAPDVNFSNSQVTRISNIECLIFNGCHSTRL